MQTRFKEYRVKYPVSYMLEKDFFYESCPLLEREELHAKQVKEEAEQFAKRVSGEIHYNPGWIVVTWPIPLEWEELHTNGYYVYREFVELDYDQVI